jgi:hypothetical protein
MVEVPVLRATLPVLLVYSVVEVLARGLRAAYDAGYVGFRRSLMSPEHWNVGC